MQMSALFAVAVAAIGAVWAPSTAEAQQTSPLVPYDSISMEPNYEIPEGEGTAYAGVDECERLIDDDRTVEVVFETAVDLTIDDRRFGGVYHYRDERGEAPGSFRCVDQDGDMQDDCEWEFDSDDYQIFPGEVEVTIPFQELTDLDDSEICETGNLDMEYFIQLRLREGATSDFEYDYADVRVVFDLIRPGPPELSDAFATQSTIQVEFEASDSEDVDRHHVVYSSESFDEGDLWEEFTDRSPRGVSGQESGQIDAQLSPGDDIYVAMVARDRAGNYSVVSEPMEVTVTETRDFWDFYVDDGGEEKGGYGCQSTAVTTPWWIGASLLLLWALGLAVRRRQRAQ